MTQIFYISTDIETDGPCPGINSMLSLASAAFIVETDNLGRNPKITAGPTFTANLVEFGDPDPETMEWWAKNQTAYDATRVNPESCTGAMRRYAAWLKEMTDKPVFVAYPAGFDFSWVFWYCHRFLKFCPFVRSALDFRSYASAVLKLPYHEVGKRTIPEQWKPKNRPHTHVALDDAIEQGEMFCNMLRDNLS